MPQQFGYFELCFVIVVVAFQLCADTEDIITLNLPDGEGAVNFAAVVKVCLGISLFFTYPMMMFPVSHLLDKSCQLHSSFSGVSVLQHFKDHLVHMVLFASMLFLQHFSEEYRTYKRIGLNVQGAWVFVLSKVLV